MAGVSGDFTALRHLVDQLGELGSPEFLRGVNANLAEAARSRIALGFEEGKDPSGRPWAPLKGREGQPLLVTGRLRNSFGPDGFGAGSFRIGTDVQYAGYHQDGTSRIPQRQMVPEGDLPETWRADFAAEIQAALDSLFDR